MQVYLGKNLVGSLMVILGESARGGRASGWGPRFGQWEAA